MFTEVVQVIFEKLREQYKIEGAIFIYWYKTYNQTTIVEIQNKTRN